MSSEQLTPRQSDARPPQPEAAPPAQARSNPSAPTSVTPTPTPGGKDASAASATSRRGWRPYLAALLFVAVGTALREGLLQPLLQGRATYVTLYPAVILAALYGGWRAGLMATVIAALVADYFWLQPAGFGIEASGDWVSMGLFVLSCTMVSAIAEVMHRARARAQEAEAAARLAALRQLETEARIRLAAIVESSADAILSTTLEGLVLTWNDGAERMLGYRAEEMLGHSITRLYPPEKLAEEKRILERIARGERVQNYETTRLTKEGRRLDVSLTVSPVADEKGRLVGASKILHDITDRKRAEEALRQSAQELTRSNRDLEQFAYVASHDLQEPLRAVSGYVQLLQHHYPDKLDEKGQRYIAGAVEGAARMQTLIHDLLVFSRVGRKSDPFEPADLNKVLAQALGNLRVSLQETEAKVTHDPLPTVPVDATQITQLFQNLINNAVKFRASRPPEVHLAASLEAGQWHLFVRDNGLGIEPQYFERIFQIFQRLHTRKQYPGTGIGLAICKKIVEHHGGRIWVESQPGQGSTFHFTLPQTPP
jgi:PAS domain S-box-containing protein